MAAVGKRRRHTVGKKKSAAPARRQIIVVGKKRHTRRRVSGIGSTSIGSHRKKRRKSGGFMGSTGKSSLMQVGEMAVGVAVGAAATHMILRPMEVKLSAKYPMATKFMGAAEILLGGFVALKSTKPFIKAIGVGVLAGGVHTVMKQTHIGLESPAITGTTDGMTHLNVPINGPLQQAIRGLIDQSGSRYVRTPTVGASVLRHRSEHGHVNHGYDGPVRTPTVGDRDDYMGTLTEDEMDFLYAPRG